MSDKPPRDKVLIEPNPANKDLFLWLEQTFDGETEYPERLEARVVSGPKFERMGPHVFQMFFDPTGEAKSESEEKSEKKASVRRRRGKPTKEELVEISNEISHRCQSDCNAQRRSCVYAVYPWHFKRGDEPYDRKLLRYDPKGVHKGGEEGFEGDEDWSESGGHRYRWEHQKLIQDSEFFKLHLEGIAALLDRQDRALEREAQSAERLRLANERLQEANFRLLTQEEERAQKAKWMDLKVRSAEKILDMGMDLAPPLLGKLTGLTGGAKNGAAIEESPESLTLKRFLKMESHGGKLTATQAIAAFGDFDETTKKCIKPGVLSEEQLQILIDVAHLHTSSDALVKLLPGEGPLSISMEQVSKLREIFPMEQIAPLMTLIGVLMQQRAAQKQPQESV